MLDVATLRELLQKTSNAQIAEEGRGLGDRRLVTRRRACALVGMDPKTYAMNRGGRTTPAFAGIGRAAPTVRLPPSAHPAGQWLSSYRMRRLTVRKRGGRKLGTRAPLAPLEPQPALVARFRRGCIGRRQAVPHPGGGGRRRECLALVVDTSLSGVRVARELDRIVELRGRPRIATTALTSNAILRAERRWLALHRTGQAHQRLCRESTAACATSASTNIWAWPKRYRGMEVRLQHNTPAHAYGLHPTSLPISFMV